MPTIFFDVNSPLVGSDGKVSAIFEPIIRSLLSTVTPSASTMVWATVAGVTKFFPLSELIPPGIVRQVVLGVTAAPVTNATNAYTDTGLTASLTPHALTSRILVLVLQNGCRKDTGNTGVMLQLLRGASVLALLADAAGATGAVGTNDVGTIAGAAVDVPASLASVTYSTQFASKTNVANAQVQYGNAVSAMALLEVAA